jgi:predicted GH43/DUF377 family glycosyl hydrolase
MNEIGIAKRTDITIRPDVTRVVTKLFIPGQELVGGSESRTSSTVSEVMRLDEAGVDRELAQIMEDFSDRHEDIVAVFDLHAQRVRAFVNEEVTPNRLQLLGAAFTHEYSLEGAAVCNPSLVAHPDQSDVAEHGLRVVMSLRAIGEGHRSTICFRDGEIDANGGIVIHPPRDFPVLAETTPTLLDRNVYKANLRDKGLEGETSLTILDGLPEKFSRDELAQALAKADGQSDIRINVAENATVLRSYAENFYRSSFSPSSSVCQRVLWPSTVLESQGMEDARFVEMNVEGVPRYVASYTAYDGKSVCQQLLETDDFVSFDSSPLVGVAAQNKGLAFFPRKIGDKFVALSRYDRAHNFLAFSSDLRCWDDVEPLVLPIQPWEMIQTGNCGSPLELDEGWLVLTHGVGPMRTYGLGALLLDLDDPSKVLGTLVEPLLAPSKSEREGYVPNVVYSCGSLIHEGTLYLPYGESDQNIGCATVDVGELVAAILS